MHSISYRDTSTSLITRASVTDDKGVSSPASSLSATIIAVESSPQEPPALSMEKKSFGQQLSLRASPTQQGYQPLRNEEEELNDIRTDTPPYQTTVTNQTMAQQRAQLTLHSPRRVPDKVWLTVAASIMFITAGAFIYHVAPLLGAEDIDPIV